jgi:hypothetical protein
MPIIPNIMNLEKSEATDTMNHAGFDRLNFYGGSGVVCEVLTDSGKTIGQEADASDLVNIGMAE